MSHPRRQSRAAIATAIGVIVATLVLATAVAVHDGGDPHGHPDRCVACHTSPPPPNVDLQVVSRGSGSGVTYPRRSQSEITICTRCHSVDTGRTHPVGIRPVRPIPEGWPLDPQGRLVCSTCHDPHRPVRKGVDPLPAPLLRGDQAGERFCQACHSIKDPGNLRGWHVLVAQTVHGVTSKIASGRWGTIDPLSARCLGCHDGTIGRDVSNRVRGSHLSVTPGTSHPIGMDYVESMGKRAGRRRWSNLVDVARLDERIRLFGGKVGCGSCHNPYASNPKFLIFSPRAGRLCLSCHEM